MAGGSVTDATGVHRQRHRDDRLQKKQLLSGQRAAGEWLLRIVGAHQHLVAHLVEHDANVEPRVSKLSSGARVNGLWPPSPLSAVVP